MGLVDICSSGKGYSGFLQSRTEVGFIMAGRRGMEYRMA